MGKRCRLNLHQTVASIVVAQDVSGADSTWEKWHGERGMAGSKQAHCRGAHAVHESKGTGNLHCKQLLKCKQDVWC